MRLLKYFLALAVITISYSQTVYELVPGTKGNLFELSFSNSRTDIIESLNISVEEAPEWVEFSKSEISIENMTTTEKQTAEFYFNISDNAPIGEEGVIKFRITDNKNRNWFKSYKVKITPPKAFEVYQNYPNPFNPTTVISWQSPVGSWQTIKVFDVLGNEAATLVDEYREAGRYEVEFKVGQTSSLSSGVY
ncbi:MAG: hypothetical protein ACK4UV_01775, partial [Ignavibacterium sp.]